MALFDRVRMGWNAFFKEEQNLGIAPPNLGASYGIRPDRPRYRMSSERSIISSIYTRIGLDVAAIPIVHARLDDNGGFVQIIDSTLNECLTVEANIDQAAQQFRQDIAQSLFDKGVVAIVPVDTSDDVNTTNSYDIFTMRVGEVVTWYPQHVRVSVYNDKKGRREEVVMPKTDVAIVVNPLYEVMNEPNSTLQRLIRKLNMLDAIDEQSSSGKLDLIIQLPYVIKTEARKAQAEERRRDIEQQLKGSQYGIAYTDGTEKITQLNRGAENNMMKQVEYLTNMLYSQLGLTESVFDGTADEKTMLNYYNRTVEPILTAICEAMRRTFLTKTARSQKQSIIYIQDPFKLVPTAQIAEIADKFTRNEILTANEIRSIMGFRPSTDPKADQLVNSNMPQPAIAAPAEDVGEMPVVEEEIVPPGMTPVKELTSGEETSNG